MAKSTTKGSSNAVPFSRKTAHSESSSPFGSPNKGKGQPWWTWEQLHPGKHTRSPILSGFIGGRPHQYPKRRSGFLKTVFSSLRLFPAFFHFLFSAMSTALVPKDSVSKTPLETHPDSPSASSPGHFSLSIEEGQPLLSSTNGYISWVYYRGHSIIRRLIKGYMDNYVWLMLTASVGLSASLTCTKLLADDVSIFQITFVRSAVSSILLLALCWHKGLSLIKPRYQMFLMVLRGITAALAFLCLSLAAFELPLSDSAFMTNSYPVITAILSWMIGIERLGLVSWIGIIGCLFGNALLAHPPFLFGGDSDWGRGRLIGVAAAIGGNILMSAAFILVRCIGTKVDSMSLTMYMHMSTLLVCFPFLPIGRPSEINQGLSASDLWCYVVLCLAGVFPQLALARGMQIGPPSKTTALLMTNMIISGFVGVVALSESTSLLSLIGAVVILMSVILVTSQNSTQPIIEKQQQSQEANGEDVFSA